MNIPIENVSLDFEPTEFENYILIERDGLKYYGTGVGKKNGSQTIYISRLEDDVHLLKAMSAAQLWGMENGVVIIYVSNLER